MISFILAKFVVQPTEFEMRQKNEKFANAARAGKKPVNPSRQERLSKQSPINIWALGIVLFVVVGGGEPFPFSVPC
jgi:hypothetical protein